MVHPTGQYHRILPCAEMEALKRAGAAFNYTAAVGHPL